MACLFISARLYQTSNNVAILENVYNRRLLNLCFGETPTRVFKSVHMIGVKTRQSVFHTRLSLKR